MTDTLGDHPHARLVNIRKHTLKSGAQGWAVTETTGLVIAAYKKLQDARDHASNRMWLVVARRAKEKP